MVFVEFRSAGLLRKIQELQQTYGRRNFDRARVVAHEEMANRIQDAMADQLRDEIRKTGRPQVDRPDHTSGALIEAILAEENRHITPGGFEVGIPEWLNESPASRYWRQIDQGAPSFLATVLFFDPGVAPANPQLWRTQARMPIFREKRSLMPVEVGPFPAYQWVAAGQRAANRLDKVGIYETVCARYGIRLTKK